MRLGWLDIRRLNRVLLGRHIVACGLVVGVPCRLHVIPCRWHIVTGGLHIVTGRWHIVPSGLHVVSWLDILALRLLRIRLIGNHGTNILVCLGKSLRSILIVHSLLNDSRTYKCTDTADTTAEADKNEPDNETAPPGKVVPAYFDFDISSSINKRQCNECEVLVDLEFHGSS